MSVDRTLHIKSGASSKRNVLSRPERIAQMIENGEFEDDSCPLGLRKTRVKHSKAGQKAKKEEAPAAGEGAEGAAATAAAAPSADAKKSDTKKPEAKKAEGKK